MNFANKKFYFCFVKFSQSKATLPLNNINWPIFIMEVQLTLKKELDFDLQLDCTVHDHPVQCVLLNLCLSSLI
jgi:hypothetical protein